MLQFQCCGIDGNIDYRRGAAAIPWSCCAGSNDPYTSECTVFYRRGCLGVIIKTVKTLLNFASLTAFVAATMQVSVT